MLLLLNVRLVIDLVACSSIAWTTNVVVRLVCVSCRPLFFRPIELVTSLVSPVVRIVGTSIISPACE